MNLTSAADLVAQHLADASQDPRGLDPASCRDLALLLDAALVQGAPVAVLKVVPIAQGRRVPA